MNTREKIKARLDALEENLRKGKHLTSDEGKTEMFALVQSVSKFFSVLADEDRDLVNAARDAIENKLVWK